MGRAGSPPPPLSRHPPFHPAAQRLRAPLAAHDDENRVVARNGADDLRPGGVVERERQRLRLSRIRLQDQKLLNLFDAPQILGDGSANPLVRERRRLGRSLNRLIGPVGGPA